MPGSERGVLPDCCLFAVDHKAEVRACLLGSKSGLAVVCWVIGPAGMDVGPSDPSSGLPHHVVAMLTGFSQQLCAAHLLGARLESGVPASS